MSVIVYDIEVAFQPEITRMVMARGLDEKKFSWQIEAGMRYVTHISYRIDSQAVVDLSLLDYDGSLEGDTNEKKLLADFAKAYNLCDESVAHYGSKFDLKFLNSRITKNGLPRLKPVRLHDTWRILKDKFLLPDNKLDTAIKFFDCPYGKPNLPWEIWRQVSLGDEKAHKKLRHRCHYDALSLWWIWNNKLKVYATRSMNRALAYDLMEINDARVERQLVDYRCPSCARRGTLKREGYNYNKTGTKFQLSCRRPQCLDWSTAVIRKDGSMGRPQ
jgi:hypothetical protein